MKKPKNPGTVTVQNLYPEVDGGRYPVKTEVDRPFIVEADVASPGAVKVSVHYRKQGDKSWKKFRD